MEEIWIGLANIAPSRQNKFAFDGAYVNVLSNAKDIEDFLLRVEDFLRGIGMLLIEMEDAEPFDSRISQYHVDDELKTLADIAKVSGKVEFSTFHSYDADSEN